jgi:hypothetical protein
VASVATDRFWFGSLGDPRYYDLSHRRGQDRSRAKYDFR